ncbi:class II aldolase/adducin N-terminal [Aspergillus heterothallicus]
MGKHFGMLRASDMVHINEAGQVIGGNRVTINSAGFVIHSAIHRATQAVYNNFRGVVINAQEGERIMAALGEGGKVIFLQNHRLLTTGATVDKAAYLLTCLKRTCEVQLKVKAAAANGLEKRLISNKAAEFTARTNADPAFGFC